MQEKDIKTSPKQRILIAVIAALMLGASVAVYIAIIISSNSSSSPTASNTQVDEAKVAELTAKYEEKSKEYEEISDSLSSKYLEKFSGYRSEVKGYNASTINESTAVLTKDLKIGSGEQLSATSTGYAAYYIGWCSDETVFDSSFDNYETPTKLKAPLYVEKDSLIEGWYLGVEGMKIGGARVVSIPGKLAYGDSQEICGGTNSPLKFLIMPIEADEKFKNLSAEMQKPYIEMIYAQYGMEYKEETN